MWRVGRKSIVVSLECCRIDCMVDRPLNPLELVAGSNISLTNGSQVSKVRGPRQQNCVKLTCFVHLLPVVREAPFQTAASAVHSCPECKP